MLPIISLSELCTTMAVLSSNNIQQLPNNFDVLENRFHHFLSSHQPQIPRMKQLGAQIITDIELEEKLAKQFTTNSTLNDKNQANILSQSLEIEQKFLCQKATVAAIDYLKQYLPEIYFALNLSIDSLFFYTSDQLGDGSTSNAIGVIWLNNKLHWSTLDLVELLVHELTHNILFIDELRYGHYQDYQELAKEENYTLSAILQSKRPVDKVLHSIVVATQVLYIRKNYLQEPTNPCVHPPSAQMHSQTYQSLNALTNHFNYKKLLSPRAKWLVKRCKQILDLCDNHSNIRMVS